MKDKLKILIVSNSWLTIGDSGIHTMKIAEALGKSNDIHFFIPNLGFALAEGYLRDIPRCSVSVYTTQFENKQNGNIYLIYFFRVVKSIISALKSNTNMIL